MTYNEALNWLDSLAPFGWKLSLHRIARLTALADHPERRFPSILVAGSAGKGSTCAMLASILRTAGLRTGSSPKPHLISPRERIRIDDQPVSEQQFAALAGSVRPLVEQTAAEGDSPTLFEAVTLMALIHFAASRVDCAVVEVGLGGRFDATNIIDPLVSVITTIHLDHTDRLGETPAEIAREKAGILRPGRPLVTAASGEALDEILRRAAELKAPVQRLGCELQISDLHLRREGTSFDLATPAAMLRGLKLPLAGGYQAENAALAVGTALLLADCFPSIDEEAIRTGLASTQVRARLQQVRERPLVLIDGAHSPDRAAALADAVGSLYLPRPAEGSVSLLIGCSTGHRPGEVAGRLAPLASRIYATRSRHPNSIPEEEVAAAARAAAPHAAVSQIAPVSAALSTALNESGPDDLILITGSLFVAGEALEALDLTG